MTIQVFKPISSTGARWELPLDVIYEESRNFLEPDKMPEKYEFFTANGWRSKKVSDRVYFIVCGELVKIGMAVDPAARLRELRIGNPAELTLVAVLRGRHELEQKIHIVFDSHRQSGEWFRLDGELRRYVDVLKAKYNEARAAFEDAKSHQYDSLFPAPWRPV